MEISWVGLSKVGKPFQGSGKTVARTVSCDYLAYNKHNTIASMYANHGIAIASNVKIYVYDAHSSYS